MLALSYAPNAHKRLGSQRFPLFLGYLPQAQVPSIPVIRPAALSSYIQCLQKCRSLVPMLNYDSHDLNKCLCYRSPYSPRRYMFALLNCIYSCFCCRAASDSFTATYDLKGVHENTVVLFIWLLLTPSKDLSDDFIDGSPEQSILCKLSIMDPLKIPFFVHRKHRKRWD